MNHDVTHNSQPSLEATSTKLNYKCLTNMPDLFLLDAQKCPQGCWLWCHTFTQNSFPRGRKLAETMQLVSHWPASCNIHGTPVFNRTTINYKGCNMGTWHLYLYNKENIWERERESTPFCTVHHDLLKLIATTLRTQLSGIFTFVHFVLCSTVWKFTEKASSQQWSKKQRCVGRWNRNSRIPVRLAFLSTQLTTTA